ncbi:hypothetical protein [Burkholderia cenocepacia]|nr:hypothetical protein [Burkholderia cenocepacia]
MNNGHLLFYNGPSAYREAEPIIAQWAAAHADFAEVGDFKTLRIVRKAA